MVCAQALTIEELQSSFVSLKLKTQTDFDNTTSLLRGNYVKALVRTQKKFQDQGRLDEALKAQAEIKIIESKIWPLPAIALPVPPNLLSVRKVFLKEYLALKRDYASTIVEAAEKMDGLLERKIIELTKMGDLAGAKNAQVYQQSLKNDQSIKDLQTFLNQVRSDGSAPAALRIRRYGDDVEVLVHYDTVGKISLDSPISNVVEISGGKRERGESKARKLGGFLGAEGYDVDSQLLFSMVFDQAQTAPLSLLDIEAGAPVEMDGKKGVPFWISGAAQNPMINLPAGTLPPLSASCGVEISCEFLVPKGNKKLEALSFHQGGGPALAERVYGKEGKWEQAFIESNSKGDVPNVRIFMGGKPGTQLPEIRGEAIVLHSLKIELTKPSAFICERFGEGGISEEIVSEISNQRPFALNGDLLPTGK